MKKLVIAAAATATLATAQAFAATYNVSSNITDVGLVLPLESTGYLPKVPGHEISLEFSGTLDIDVTGSSYVINGGNLFLNGEMSLVAAGAEVTLNFVNATGTASNDGFYINSGTLEITASTGPFPSLDLSTTNVDMTNNGTFLPPGAASPFPITGLPLGSGAINGDGSIDIALLGLPGAPLADANSVLSGVAGIQVFGFDTLLFLQGGLTLTPVSEVPVPGAAWMLGSALVGLAGVARKRKAA